MGHESAATAPARPRRARLPTLLLAGALLATLAAGCLARAPTEANPDSTGTTTPPTATTRATGFDVLDLSIRPADGSDRALREDDEARITWTLRNAADAPASYLVSYILDGAVSEVRTVTLGPGEAKPYEERIASLRDVKTIDVEVRAGSGKATAHADVHLWPRTRDRVDLGPVFVTVERWLKNATTSGTDVNVTIERKLLPEGDYRMLRAHVLCASPDGKVTAHGEARPDVPEPGNASMTDLWLPACGDILYGIDITGKWAQGDFYTRVLFVEPGWRPPAS